MELPDLGDNCQEPSCNTLDFLPFKCDACKKVFCKDHYTYNKHSCSNARKDFQVPLCPLCSQPVPYKRSELPDIMMSAHIDRDCKSDPAEDRRRKIYSNKCFKQGCKKKELVPFQCSTCRKNYCIRHRNEIDHECSEVVAKSVGENKDVNSNRLKYFGLFNQSRPQQPSRAAATSRTSQNQQPTTSSLNNAMTEQEALDYALKLSLQESTKKAQGTTGASSGDSGSGAATTDNREETEDEILARVLAQSEREYQQKKEGNSCSIG